MTNGTRFIKRIVFKFYLNIEIQMGMENLVKRYITTNKTGLRLVHRPCIRVDVAILVGGAREVQLFGLKIKHLSFWKI